MEPESELPPPPYSEVDPSQATTSESSTMGGGDYSPSSTLRPTSSQSLRAPSFITLRGGYLRGVPFSEDPVTNSYFQERAFQFDPTRESIILHREITADTTRADLPCPDIEQDRDVAQQDWQTFVNYILTELGNETSSVRHRKKLSAEDFYQRQTKLEELISEWNEAFFQPRSIKFIAHFYYKHPRSPAPTHRSRRAEAPPELQRIPIEDGTMSTPQIEHHHHRHSMGHYPPAFSHRGGPFIRGHPFMRGHPHVRGDHSHLPFVARGMLANMMGPGRHGYGSGPWHDGHYYGRGRTNDFGRHDGQRREESQSSNSSSSSGSDSDTGHRHGSRRNGRRGRRDRQGDRHNNHRRRSRSASSESSLSSVSSISSDEMNESAIGAVKDAIANFRLDPTNSKHNRMAYKQLLQGVRAQKREALRNRASNGQEVRKVSKAQRRAIRDDLRSLRTEAKQVLKDSKAERKIARREAKKAQKQARKAIRDAGKAARKAMKNKACLNTNNSSRGQTSGTIPAPSYDMPGSFPDSSNEQTEHQVQELEYEIRLLEEHVKSLKDKADRDTRGITQPEKQKLARASYDEEIKEIEEQIVLLRNEISQLRGTNNDPSQAQQSRSNPTASASSATAAPGYGTRAAQQGEQWGRQMEDWGERFGRDMENLGENFGRQFERWGQEFGKRMSERGNQLGQRFG